MPFLARIRDLSRRQKIALAFGIFVLLYALTGFLLVPYLARTKLPPLLSEKIGRPVSIERVSLNPFALALSVRGFRVDDSDGKPLVSLGELGVNVQLSSIFRRALTLKEFRLTSPSVRVRVLPDGKLSFADIIERLSSKEAPAEPAEESKPFPVIVQRAAIENGRITIRDESHKTPFEEEIAPIDIALNDFTTRPDVDSPLSFTAVTENGASLTWQGTFSAIPLRSTGEIRIADFRSRTPWRYLRDDLRFEIASGTAAATAKYTFDGGAKPPRFDVKDATFALQNISIFEVATGTQVVGLPSFSVSGGAFDFAAREGRIASVTSNGARMRFLREQDGGLRIVKILTPERSAPPAGEAASSEPAAAPPPSSPPAAPPPPWKITVDSIHIADYGLDFVDLSTPAPTHLAIAPINLDVSQLSTVGPAPATVKLGIGFEQGGSLETDGTLALAPLAAKTHVTLKDFAVALIQPYVDQASGVVLRDGRLSTDLDVSYGGGEGETPLGVSGSVGLTGLDAGVRGGDDLIALTKLGIEGLSLGLEPTAVKIAKLDLVAPRVTILRRADGTTNLASASERATSAPAPAAADTAAPAAPEAASPDTTSPPAGAPPAASAPAAEGPPVSIELPLITLSEGAVTVRDASLPSPFTLQLDALAGEVRGFALRPDAKVDVDLAGKIARSGTLDIDASLTPLAPSPDGKVRFKLTNLDMTGFSPYSGKYVGQDIAKGKLGVDLDYTVKRSTLEAENNIGLDAFTLGKHVESPDATDLPVGLALALLKDTSGKIALDVPVSGRLDDPGFRIGKVVLQTLKNLILKAATAPFALLGSLVPGGGGDELGRIAFAPGSAEISQAELDKLDKLATALAARPNLRLDIAGATDPALDPPALGTALVEAKLKSMRFEEVKKRSDAPASAVDVVLDEKHYDELLAELYETRSGKRVKELRREAPQPADGEAELDVDAWVKTEMQKRLVAILAIGERELGDLASRRADAIVAHLVAGGQLPAERVFVVAPRADAPIDAGTVLVELALAPS